MLFKQSYKIQIYLLMYFLTKDICNSYCFCQWHFYQLCKDWIQDKNEKKENKINLNLNLFEIIN